jgi:hypothetical protein
MSRFESLLARFPEPKFKRRRLYATKKECEDSCICFLHKHFCPPGCGRHECWERIEEEIELRLAAENFTTDLLNIVRDVKATISSKPRAAMDLLNKLPKPTNPSSFQIKEIDEDNDECDPDDGCENEMHSHFVFCDESSSCDEEIRTFFESRILAESIKNSYLIGIDSLRRELSAYVQTISHSDEFSATAAAAAATAVVPSSSSSSSSADKSKSRRLSEHEQSCPLYEREGIAKRCICGDISPFYPEFKR